MIRVIHTGDLHLDSPFRGLPAEKARQRREEQRGLLDRLAALCAERQADVVLIAGDLFDGDGVYYETTRMLADVFGSMKAKIFIAPGNHDPYSDSVSYTHLDVYKRQVHSRAIRWFDAESDECCGYSGVVRHRLPGRCPWCCR